MKYCDNTECNGQRDVVGRLRVKLKSQGCEEIHDKLGDHIFPDPAQAEAGDRDAELCCGQIRVKIRDNVFRERGHGVAFFCLNIDLRGPDLDDCEFGGYEKSIKKNEKNR